MSFLGVNSSEELFLLAERCSMGGFSLLNLSLLLRVLMFGCVNQLSTEDFSHLQCCAIISKKTPLTRHECKLIKFRKLVGRRLQKDSLMISIGNILFSMSKENIRKHTSMKRGQLMGLEHKEPQPSYDSDPKISTMSEVSRQIQNKIKMRKRSTRPNDKHQALAETQSISSLAGDANPTQPSTPEVDSSIVEAIERQLTTNQEILDQISLKGLDLAVVREKLISDGNFLHCQVYRGQSLGEVMLQKIDFYVRNNEAEKRVRDREDNILSMIENRIEKLKKLQKGA